MESPGEYLKREREIRGIRLEAISDATKIRAGLLSAIEKNDFDALPATPFVKGFIQAYCKYLGLDVQDALLRYEAYMRSIAENKAPALKTNAGIKNEKPEALTANSSLAIVAIAAIVVLIILSGLYAISKKRALHIADSSISNVNERPAGSAPHPANGVEAKKTEAILPADIAPERQANMTIEPPVSKIPSKKEDKETKQSLHGNVVDKGPLTVVIKAVQPSWLKAEIDGQNTFEVSLKQGETVTWSAREKLSILIGNAGGVNVLFNGEPLGALGEEGKVVKLTLPQAKNKD